MRKTILNLKTLLPLAYHSFRWHIRYYLGKKSFPMACGVFLTNRCNLSCHMCSIWTDKKKQSLSLAQVKQLIDAITPGLCYLSFSGGEPLLVDGLMDMIAYAAKKIPHIHLVTNGLLIDDEIAERLARAGLTEISISLDGDRQWHNRLRNSDKSFDAVVNGIESLKRAAPKIIIVANTVIFPDRLEQTRQALAITEKLKVRHKVQPVNKHFLFDNSTSDQYMKKFKAVDMAAVQDLVDTLIKNRRVVNSRLYLAIIPSYFKGTLHCPMTRHRCRVPHFFLEASSYGRVSPCMIATGWQGSLKINEALRKNLFSHSYEKEKHRLESCKKCNKSMYICYWEPMINFPISHFIKYNLMKGLV